MLSPNRQFSQSGGKSRQLTYEFLLLAAAESCDKSCESKDSGTKVSRENENGKDTAVARARRREYETSSSIFASGDLTHRFTVPAFFPRFPVFCSRRALLLIPSTNTNASRPSFLRTVISPDRPQDRVMESS